MTQDKIMAIRQQQTQQVNQAVQTQQWKLHKKQLKRKLKWNWLIMHCY